MEMTRGTWVILAAAVLVAIAVVASQTPRGPVVSPAPPTPATSPEPVARDAAALSPPATSPPVVQSPTQTKEPAPVAATPTAAPSAHSDDATSSPAAPAAAQASPPPTSSAPNATNEPSPAAAATPAPVAGTAANEAAPASQVAPTQPTAAPPDQPSGKETTSASASGEKEQANVENDEDSRANDKAKAELVSLQPGFVPKDLIAALNDSVINFASDSAEIPASTMEFLQKAASDLKQLPTGHVVEIAGYTDNTGDEALNVALSQRRADAVRNALIGLGAAPDMLAAKGYGSADPIASNETPDGRKRNRRIEYRIIKTPT